MKKQLNILDHPIIQHVLGILRDKNTNSPEFRRIMNEISRLLAYEATRELPTTEVTISTPMGQSSAKKIIDAPVVVSIMRAGNGMLDGILSMLPYSSAGHIGIYRDKFIKNTVEYYFRLPDDVKGKTILLADPLMATGDTVMASVDRLKQYGVGNIKLLSILVSKFGVERLLKSHPDVEIFATGVEEELDDNGFIVPGIGDAGSRLYQTCK